MLSVILYGRNDNHGYNLHKRAAISLNAIAHLLSDPADEIVFVDYNTPDDLPTFPEAIADTLTPKAIEKLRVLRLRPAVHQARYAARTHLNALEPIARNVAIRRANPANRWVLSTNTDMIFVPRIAGQDLTTAIGGLQDGYYHLPRFELPEGLWETLDRRDAAGMIESARDWGQRFHLNEIVKSAGDNLYDGPGDFQLFLREDLYAIGGFHEEMIRGWHLDANVAKRMAMLRGRVSSALDRLIGYHCDHTRQATAYHKGDRIENSPTLFVDNVFEPQIRAQLSDWGLPDEPIEELKLGQAAGARYLRGLDAAGGSPDGEPDVVLPYLLDLVSSVPAETRVGYAGGGALAARFAAAWRAMGETAARTPDTLPPVANAEPVTLSDWAAGSDLFIVERSGAADVETALQAAAAAGPGREVLIIGDPESPAIEVVGRASPRVHRGRLAAAHASGGGGTSDPLPMEAGKAFSAADIVALTPPPDRKPTAHFGSIFDRLEALGDTRRTPMALRLAADQGDQLAARAELGILPPGYYELQFDTIVEALQAPGEILAIGVVGDGRLLAEQVEAASAPGRLRVTVSFDVDARAAEASGGLLVGLKGLGLAEVDLSDLVLR
jgi:hypothetical protein